MMKGEDVVKLKMTKDDIESGGVLKSSKLADLICEQPHSTEWCSTYTSYHPEIHSLFSKPLLFQAHLRREWPSKSMLTPNISYPSCNNPENPEITF